jgi:site-specific DNA-methyltransferase (adenine-specific)
MAQYDNVRGKRDGRPYFSLDHKNVASASTWAQLRAKFSCPMGITNVWRQPQVAGSERINGTRQRMKWKYRSLHGSQKPLKLIEISIQASTDEDDVVWEPFGGLCPAAICSARLGRRSLSAEIIPEFYSAAVERLSRSMTPRLKFENGE